MKLVTGARGTENKYQRGLVQEYHAVRTGLVRGEGITLQRSKAY